MIERPILFSAPMVKAIQERRKTQTRRIIKVQPPAEAVDAGLMLTSDPKTNGQWIWLDSPDIMEASMVGDWFKCPYGLPGDRLWVRERHRIVPLGEGQSVLYADDIARGVLNDPRNADWAKLKDRPSIHMPRWASRYLLQVEDVRVQRLQDITPADALAEGVYPNEQPPATFDRVYSEDMAVHLYGGLWDHINGKGAWDANPWVWAVTFDPIQTTSLHRARS